VPTGELLPIVAQILRGLSAIHAAGIVHRDLKPENIFLLHEPGGQLRVVVMDFGLARIEDGRVSSTQSSAASMVGTPNYMAPEQSLGSAPTVAWDIFALGVILYRAVAGELPFKGNTAVALAMARIKERAPRLSSAVPDVAPWFEQIVAKCLERTPASRYANVAELEHAFANRKPSRARSRSQLLGAGVLVAVGAVGVLAFAWQYSRHTQKHRPSAGSLASLAVQGNQASLAASPVTQASGVQSVVPLTPMPGQPIAAALESATVAGAKVPAIRARSVSRLAPTPVPSSLRVVSRPEVEALPPLPGEDEIVVPEFAKPTQKRVEP
jgi:serine/threonine-protein kinase